MSMDTFRALPRPVLQWLIILLIWPVWFVLGIVEAIRPGLGITIQNMLLKALNGLPDQIWPVIVILALGAQVYRSYEKRLKMQHERPMSPMTGDDP